MKSPLRGRCLVPFLSLWWAGACASSQPQTLESALRTDPRPRTILVGVSKPPRASASAGYMVGSVLAGPIGGLAAGGPGSAIEKQLVERHRLVDPAAEVGRALTGAFARRHRLEVKPSREIDSRPARKFFRADLVLDVTTESWALEELGASPSTGKRFRLLYRARLEVYDTRSQQTLTSGVCLAPTLKPAAAPTWNQLEEDDAKILKDELTYAANYCLRHFGRRVLFVWLDGTESLYGETDPPVREEAASTHEPQL